MIRLHHCPESRSMRILWLLHEMRLDFEVRVWPFDKSLRSEEFLALNPVGRVPALEIDGEFLWESGAIMQVLCERFPQAGLGRDLDDPERAEWLIWLHFAETMSQHSAALTQQHVALYEDSMRSPIITQLEPRRLGKCYAALEVRLQGRDWLLSRFSAADVACGQALYMSQKFARVEGYPNVAAWLARIEGRKAFQASLPRPNEARLYARDFYEPLP